MFVLFIVFVFFFQAEDGIRDLVRSRGLGDVYKRQVQYRDVPGHFDRGPCAADSADLHAVGPERESVQHFHLSLIHI